MGVQMHMGAPREVAEGVCHAAGGLLLDACVEDHDVLTPVVVAAARWTSANPGTPASEVTSLLVQAFDLSALWRSLCVLPLGTLVSQMWRWSYEGCARARALRAGASTELLIHLIREDRLSTLVSYAALRDGRGDGEEEWGRLLHVLKRMWPERIGLLLGTPPAAHVDEAERSVHECPITLERCVRPVVASDGRIYERDAILTHMTTSSTSPLTGQPILHALVDLYA